MNSAQAYIRHCWQWAKADFVSYPLRFILEVIAWAMSIACSIIMSVTVPDAPFLLLYPLFIAQCAIFGWAAWTRRSFGMIGNYTLIVMIDSFALGRLLLT